jgi:cytoskeleton protein RodZ
MNPIQNPLFKEPVGMTFKAKRESMGLSIEEVSKSLKFGTHLVQAIETEQWDKLGPAIYANSYLNSYIKFLGLHDEIRNEIPRLKSAPALKTISTEKIAPSGSLPKKILAFLTFAGLLALSAFLYSRYRPVEVVAVPNTISMSASMPLETLKSKNPITQTAISGTALTTTTEIATSDLNISTDLATPVDSNTMVMSSGDNEITINTSQEAWVEVRDSQNAVVFKELIPANQERRQTIKNAGKITLGNASNVEVSINGVTLKLAPFIINDVARFTVDENGKAVAFTQ